MRTLFIATLISLMTVNAASAATVNETDFAGGFSSPNQFFNPTYTSIGFGVDTINGTATANNFDFLRFTDLEAGAQTLTFNFALQIPAGQSNVFQNAGGQLYYSENYLSGPYNGTNAGTFAMARDPFNLPGTPTTTLSFTLANSFAGGDLFVNILPQFGQAFSYSLAITGNGGGPAPVPLPPAGALLLAAFGALILRRRMRRDVLHTGLTQAT